MLGIQHEGLSKDLADPPPQGQAGRLGRLALGHRQADDKLVTAEAGQEGLGGDQLLQS